MDHQSALSSQAVERYTLGELTSPEREAFEEHFFDCPACAQALREYEIFAANARAVFREDAQAQPDTVVVLPKIDPSAAVSEAGWWGGFRKWFAVPAVALAGLVFAFVMLRNPAPDPNGPVTEWTLVTDARSGAVPHQVIDSKAAWVQAQLPLLSLDKKRWDSYHWELRGADGSLIAQGDGHGNEKPLTIKVAASQFASQKTYKLTVQGDPAAGPISSSFVADRN